MRNKYQVFINKKLVISGIFASTFAAFLAAADAFGGNRVVGSIVVRLIK